VTVAAALPAMVARGRGQVVAIGSTAGFRGLPAHGAYCASKAAVHTFMESVRVDLRGTGVRATTISPGFVKTELTAKAKFPMPYLMELDDATRLMVRAIDAGRPRLSFPWQASWFMRTVGVLPAAIYERLAVFFRDAAARPQR
jgi:short-subunit dehydrogenase